MRFSRYGTNAGHPGRPRMKCFITSRYKFFSADSQLRSVPCSVMSYVPLTLTMVVTSAKTIYEASPVLVCTYTYIPQPYDSGGYSHPSQPQFRWLGWLYRTRTLTLLGTPNFAFSLPVLLIRILELHIPHLLILLLYKSRIIQTHQFNYYAVHFRNASTNEIKTLY